MYNNSFKITGSIVLYKNDRLVLTKAIQSFFNTEADVTLYLIDNSPTNSLKDLVTDKRIIYIHNPSNPGFGSAHNKAIELATKSNSKYHFIINPDIYFTGDVVASMANYMEANPNVGMMMPEVLNPDGSIQNLPKLLPLPGSILLRKFKKPSGYYKKFINKYELRLIPRHTIYNAPILSGCFTLLNLKAINQIGGYDDRYFMYFEDWDLSRRMAEKYDTVYFPEVSVYHEYTSGANRSFHLFRIFLSSAIHYFTKWGWFFDSSRKNLNAKALQQFK